MKNKIRKAILEAEERKQRVIVERQIVTERFTFLLESARQKGHVRNFSDRNKIKLLFAIAEEFNYLEKNLISESGFDLTSILSGLFGKIFSGTTVETIAEPFVAQLLAQVGITGGFWQKFLVSFITSKPTDFLRAMGDCNTMVRLLSEAVIEGFVMQAQESIGAGGWLFNWVRNELGNSLKDTDAIKKLEDAMTEPVCAMLGKFTENAKELMAKIS